MMHSLVLSCHRASELIEKRTVSKLTVKEKAQLAMHETICTACKKYHKQSDVIEQAIERITSSSLTFEQGLSGHRKEKIIEEIRKRILL